MALEEPCSISGYHKKHAVQLTTVVLIQLASSRLKWLKKHYREIYVFEYDIVIHRTPLVAFSRGINYNKINELKSR